MGTFLGNGYGIWKPTFTLDGTTKIFQTIFMFKNDASGAASAINAGFRTNWVSANRPFNASQMWTGFTLARTECYVMLGGVLTYDIDETAVVGIKAGTNSTPINTSIIVRKNTGIVGKRFRGRWLLPNLWIAELNVNQAGIIDGTGQGVLSALWTPAFNAQMAGTAPLVLGHTTSEVIPTPLTGYSINPKIGSMPHRIRGF